MVTLLIAFCSAPAGAGATAPSLLWRAPEDGGAGAGAAQVRLPAGIAASPLDGHLFLADRGNARIDEFDVWGQLVKTWGWGVVASGPHDAPPVNEVQQVTVSATGGTYRLRYFNAFGDGKSFQQLTVPINFDWPANEPGTPAIDSVQEALEGLESIEPGDVKVSGGPGDAAGLNPYTIEFTGNYADSDIPQLQVRESTLAGGGATATVSTSQGGGSFEICVPSVGDVCQEGQNGGAAPGQLDEPYGVAVDPTGNVYVAEMATGNVGEEKNLRVQKFAADGSFALMWGGEVNKTKSAEVGSSEAERNLCTKAQVEAGDTCGAGTPGAGKGQFAAISIDQAGNRIALGTGGSIFVGDVGRIQEFSQGGAYLGEVKVPGETVRYLAMDTIGNFYTTFAGKNNVRKLDSAGAELLAPVFPATNPGPVALDGAGNVYVVAHPGSLPGEQDRVLEYSPSGAALIPSKEEGEEGQHFAETGGFFGGLATSGACGIDGEDLYVTDRDGGFLRAFGPAPDPSICPQSPVPPIIKDQYAISAGPDGATVGAKINPRFWSDARYYVEFGTGKCSEGGCNRSQPPPPGARLTDADTLVSLALPTAGVFLPGLAPKTTYHFRFVAQSSGGGPVRGVGGTLELDGAEGTFKTLAQRPAAPNPDPCPNASLRGGASAQLPDCRAYEMVSPVDKNNGDILALRKPGDFNAFMALNQSSTDGERFTYSSYRSFGDAQSAPFTSTYMATRGQTGWSSHGISPPRGINLLEVASSSDVQFKAFSADLCGGWLVHESDPPLTSAAPEGFADIYERDNCGPGADGYEALSSVEPPEADPLHFLPELQGVAADGGNAIFRAGDQLTPDAPVSCEIEGEGQVCRLQLYESVEGGGLRYVCLLPDGSAVSGGCSAGTASGGIQNDGRSHSVYNAISDDGSRVFWSDSQGGQGRIYLRVNADQEQSVLAHVAGTGNLTKDSKTVSSLVAAKGTGTLTEGSTEVTSTIATVGQFVVGQPLAGTGIPPGTTIASVEGSTLVLSAAVEAGKSGMAVPITSAGPAPFAIGQPIAGNGIPPGTTITAVALGSLTLSAAATSNKVNVKLDATSGCTEPEKACTQPVSEGGEALSGKLGGGAQYWTAAANGSTAIYTVGSLVEGQADFYEFDVATKTTTPVAHHVFGLLGASSDAKRLYLVSADAVDGGAVVGQPNLYLHEAGGGLTFIATLSKVDANPTDSGADLTPVNLVPKRHTAEVSEDGLRVTFMSTASLTGYDNTDVNSGEADAEVYLYDAAADTLACASCNPTGARPSGRDIGRLWAAARISASQTQVYRVPHVLAAKGRRLYFESFEALAPADTNGKQDVYQWETPGQGDCSQANPAFSEDAGGCISLISSGEGAEDSALVDTSADGSDVFIATSASLLPQDPGLLDVYDARVEGGFPPPSEPPPFCEGEACQSAPPPPAALTPGSSTFRGPVRPGAGGRKARCPKGKRKVRKAGKTRCVAKKKHKRAPHRRHRRRGEASR